MRREKSVLIILLLTSASVIHPTLGCYVIPDHQLEQQLFRHSNTYRGICNTRGLKCFYVCRSENSRGGRCAYHPERFGLPWDCVCMCYNY